MSYQKHWAKFVQIPWIPSKHPDLDVTFIEHEKCKNKEQHKGYAMKTSNLSK